MKKAQCAFKKLLWQCTALQYTQTHQITPQHLKQKKKEKKIGGLKGIYRSISMPYLQQFNALCECSSVKAGFTACSIYVALDSIMMLAT